MNVPDLAKLKITLVAGTLGQGGAERQLFHVVRALHGCGAEVRVLCLTQGEFWQERIESLGVPVIWVGENPSRAVRLRRIVAELRRFRPEVVQSFHFFTNFYATVAGRIVGIPDVGALRSDGLSELRAYGRLLGRVGMRWPRVLAANSLTGIENARNRGVAPGRLYFLPNVIDTLHYRPPLGGEGGRVDNTWNLVAVGRLGPEKRFDRVIRMVEKIQEWPGLPLRITIVGEGPLRDEWEALATNLGVADTVHFAGAVADTRPFLWAANAAILTSYYEGTPNVLIEAQACGLPVVSTDAGGVRQVMRDGQTGTIVPQGVDEAEIVRGLASAVQALREDAQKCALLGRQGCALVEEEFAMARLPTFLSELYTLALGR